MDTTLVLLIIDGFVLAVGIAWLWHRLRTKISEAEMRQSKQRRKEFEKRMNSSSEE